MSTDRTVDGIAILLWGTDPARPALAAAPFLHAAAAAALDVPVEIYFTGDLVRLLVSGVADAIAIDGHARSLGDAIREAHDLGARLLACPAALAERGIEASALVRECQGRAGPVQFMSRAADPRWRTLVF